MTYALVIVFVIAALNLANTINYLLSIKNGVRPHALSWIGFCALASVGFATSVAGHGGLGTWTALMVVVITGTIAVAALKVGDFSFTRFDWVALGGAAFGAAIWPVTSSADIASIIVSVAGVIAFLPSVRKSWKRPYDDQAVQFAIVALSISLRISALTNINIATALFPASQLASNAVYAVFLMIRRRFVTGPSTVMRACERVAAVIV
jgi:hypothetical protein